MGWSKGAEQSRRSDSDKEDTEGGKRHPRVYHEDKLWMGKLGFWGGQVREHGRVQADTEIDPRHNLENNCVWAGSV